MYAFNKCVRLSKPCRCMSIKVGDKTTKRSNLPNSNTKIIRRARKADITNIKKSENEKAAIMKTNSAPEEVSNCVIKEHGPSSELRFNEINVQMISRNLYQQLFKEENKTTSNPDVVSRCRQVLSHHNINLKECTNLDEVNLKLPKLRGNDILEHFYNIGEQQSAPYRRLIEEIVKYDIPPLPKQWVFSPGWHRYDKDGNATPVPFPPEDVLVFDVEVCMSVGTNPTLACAVSPTCWYGWVSKSLVDGGAKISDATHHDMDHLVPMESHPESRGYDLEEEMLRPKLVVGHNVSFDRARIKEQYWVERTGTRFLDTMSMHICVSGVTSYQRAVLKSKDKEFFDPDDETWMQISSLNSLAEVHKLYTGEPLSKLPRDTFVEGTLEDVKNDFQNLMTYCASDVVATSSVLRKIYPMFKDRFPHPVTLAGILEIGTAYLPVNSNWDEYINSADLIYEDVEMECKSLLAKKAEKACRLMHDQQYAKDLWMWDQDWSTQSLKINSGVVVKKGTKKKKITLKEAEEKQTEYTASEVNDVDDANIMPLDENVLGSLDYKGNFIRHIPKKKDSINQGVEDNPNSSRDSKTKECSFEDDIPDPLEAKFASIFNRRLPLRRPLLPGYPAWYRKLCSKPESDPENWVPGPHNISTSMQITPKLLSLSWEGYPLHYIREKGWGFLVPFRTDRPSQEEELTSTEDKNDRVPLETLVERCPVMDPKDLAANAEQSEAVLGTLWKDVESEIGKRDFYSGSKSKKNDDKRKNSAYKGSGVWSGVTLAGSCIFMRLPHKDGPSKNVGNPLAKGFLNKFSENVLGGEGKEAEKVLTAARMLSYWRNNRNRIKEQKVVWLEDKYLTEDMKKSDKRFGAIVPQIVVCGTLTRRAMEPTWLTASNSHKERIGSELRAMVQSPPGYCFVGADVDSQELWIAAILGDSQFGIHGATPFGWMTLSGSKAAGTDMHSHTAKTTQITRDHAKVINYARIYGAGQNFAEKLLKQFNPSISDWEAKTKAKKMFSTTKGLRYYRLKDEYIERVYGEGHVESAEEPLLMLRYLASTVAKQNGKLLEEMFERPKWIGGTESNMFNHLEEIAGSEEPRTPFLECQLTRALMTDEELRKRHLPTAINWVVQSGAVDFLHLMLVNMAWLTGNNARFCLSFHDEVRYMVPQHLKYETALAMHITNLYTRAFCAKKLGFNDLPQSVAFFSSVDVDTSLRKEAHLDCVTPSNPHGLSVGYSIPLGEALDIHQTLKKCPDGLDKLYKEEDAEIKDK